MDHLIRFIIIAVAKLFAPFIARVQTRTGDAWRRYRASGWFTVYGRIHQARVGNNDAGYFLDLTYSYEQLGEFYSGRRRREAGRESEADRLSTVYSSGSSVVVRVHPQRPEKSVLVFRDQLVESQPW